MKDGGDARLNEYDKAEWRDVYRILKPGGSDEDFEQLWAEFVTFKAARRAN